MCFGFIFFHRELQQHLQCRAECAPVWCWSLHSDSCTVKDIITCIKSIITPLLFVDCMYLCLFPSAFSAWSQVGWSVVRSHMCCVTTPYTSGCMDKNSTVQNERAKIKHIAIKSYVFYILVTWLNKATSKPERVAGLLYLYVIVYRKFWRVENDCVNDKY